MTLLHDVSSEYSDTAQAVALKRFLHWRNQGGLAVAVQATQSGPQGRVWEFAAVPVCEARIPAPVLAFTADLEGELAWETETTKVQALRLLALSGLPMFGEYSGPLRRVMAENQCFAWDAERDKARLGKTLEQYDGGSEVPALLSVAAAYAPLTDNWDAENGGWQQVSLERACELEAINISDLQPHTAYGEAVALARLIDAVAFGASGIRYIL